MARSFRELGKESTELIEQGKELESQVERCKAQIQSASVAVVAARQNLEQASQIDEDGNTAGDVSEASARLAVAQNQLAASQRALQRAQQAVDNNNQKKRLQVLKIEQHKRTSRSNISRLRALGDMSFSENVDEVQQGLIERHNEIEQARIALLESMGEKACPETITPTSFGGGTADWSGAGYGALDLSGEEYSHKGNNSTVISNTASVNYNENNSSGNNMTSSSDESNNGVLNAKSVDSNEKPKLRIRLFKRKQRGKGKPVYFSGFEVDRHINGSTFFVKGANYEKFKKDYYSSEDFVYTMFDFPKTIYISPDLIEGIDLGKYDVDNLSVFWSQHLESGTRESFLEIAKHIPEVRKQLMAGRTVDELLENPELSECTRIYFIEKVKVRECDGYYEFESNGRHRILAARELGYEIPVIVTGIKEREVVEKYKFSANKLLETMPKKSEFNPNPLESMSNSLYYNYYRHGKDSYQYQSLASRKLDPIRADISKNEMLAEEYGKKFEELNRIVESCFKFSSDENKSKLLNRMRDYRSNLKIIQEDINLKKEHLRNEANRLGINKEHLNTRFVGFNGNTDICHACDNIITSAQTGGTCGVNCSVSCENQIKGTHKTQYEGFKSFAENKWCITSANTEGEIGGTNVIHREKYLNSQGLDCDSRIVGTAPLNEIKERMFRGESVILTVHAQDLRSVEFFDSESRKPHIEKVNGRDVLVIDNHANHAVNVVGFEVNDFGEVMSVYINDTGKWNDYTDKSGKKCRVNLIPIPVDKFRAMCQNTNGMYVQFVKKRG